PASAPGCSRDVRPTMHHHRSDPQSVAHSVGRPLGIGDPAQLAGCGGTDHATIPRQFPCPRAIPVRLLAAASTIAVLPTIIVGWLAQKRLVRGLAMGAMK